MDERDQAQAKTVVRREVYIDLDTDGAQYTFQPRDLDLWDGQSMTQWVEHQKSHGQTAYSTAKDLDLLDGVELWFQLIEHYDDGTHKCVERVSWKAS